MKAKFLALREISILRQHEFLRHYSAIENNRYEKEYKQSITKPEIFWSEKANLLEWFKKPNNVLDRSNPPFSKWFVDGELNAAYNCLDLHVKNGFGSQIAIIHDSPLTSSTTKVTFQNLQDEVAFFAGVLSKHGITKGDRVLIYMPMIPQAIVAMLATARLGAIHSLVFGGFASKELSTRINHAKPKICVSANTGVEPGRLIDYNALLCQAIEMSSHKPKKCIYYNRPMFPPVKSNKLNNDYSLCYMTELSKARVHDCVPVKSTDPLYLLYTSGTTGTPKGVVRSTGDYLVALKYSMKALYGMNPGETWWAASDLGWVVGHSYICYGPLASRNTSVLYEGKPVGTPDSGAYFRVIDEHNVTGMFTAPTAIRAIIQTDPKAKLAKNYSFDQQVAFHFLAFDFSLNNKLTLRCVWLSLRNIFLAGEHCDHETMNWVKNVIGKPGFDHWWQTETGWPITSTCVGLLDSVSIDHVPIGVSGKPVPGYDVRVLKNDQIEAEPGQLGRIVVKLPLPPGTFNTLWENDELFKSTYFKKYPDFYDTMDVGYKSKDGYVTVLSRADDVINVAGHRISAGAIEEVILECVDLADCAVVARSDQLKGDVPFAFICLRKDSSATERELTEELVRTVRNSIGPVASFKHLVIVKRLPKTRSGKIARNCLKAMLNNQTYRAPVTIEDVTVFDEIKEVLLQKGFENITSPSN